MWCQYQWSSLLLSHSVTQHTAHITLLCTIKLAFLYTAICYCISLTRMKGLSQELSRRRHVSLQVTYISVQSLEGIRSHPFESFGLTKPPFFGNVFQCKYTQLNPRTGCCFSRTVYSVSQLTETHKLCIFLSHGHKLRFKRLYLQNGIRLSKWSGHSSGSRSTGSIPGQPCQICGGQNGTGRVFRFCPVMLHRPSIS